MKNLFDVIVTPHRELHRDLTTSINSAYHFPRISKYNLEDFSKLLTFVSEKYFRTQKVLEMFFQVSITMHILFNLIIYEILYDNYTVYS